jgi:isoquinoline 1-oxidoreductase beta subunit
MRPADTASENIDLQRRRLLVAGLSITGGLVLGVPLLRAAGETAAAPSGGQLGFFIEIRPDNTVVIGCAQPEIGQGVRTALPMLVAEELEMDWDRVTASQMPLAIIKTSDGFTWQYGGQGAGGSTSITDNWTYLREVGARARLMLTEAAAQRWSVPAAQSRAASGRIHHDASGSSASYAELAAEAAA